MSRSSISPHAEGVGYAPAQGAPVADVEGNAGLLSAQSADPGVHGTGTKKWRQFWRWAYDEAA